MSKVIDNEHIITEYDDIIVNLFKPYISSDYSLDSYFDELEDMLYLEYNGLFKQTKNNLVENKIIDAEIFVYRKCSLSAMLSNLKLYKNGKLFVKIPNCKGLKFNVREQGQLILDFSIVMGFYKDRLILNITPSSKKYYIRYECDESSCGYTIVPPEIGSKEYNKL